MYGGQLRLDPMGHGFFLDEYIFILAEVLFNTLIIIRPPANITNSRRMCGRIIFDTSRAQVPNAHGTATWSMLYLQKRQ